MKRLRVGGLMLSLILSASIGASAQHILCRNGFRFQISQTSWGKQLPVITAVLPHSPAEQAGLAVGDVINQIDGVPTRGLSEAQIKEILFQEPRQQIFKVTSMGHSPQSKILNKECKLPNSFTERELAELFALYSIEDVNSQSITYPFTYAMAGGYDLSQVKTYRIVPSSNESTKRIDDQLNRQIEALMQSKGLRPSNGGADITISTYYKLSPLKPYVEDSDFIPFSWRYDPKYKDIKPLPIISGDSQQVEYRLTFGLVMTDTRSKQTIWSCEANESLSKAMSIEEYGDYTIPVMLQGFPWVSRMHHPSWIFQTLRYNYTGLVYNKFDLSRIVDVEVGSPAMKAGLLPGDIVRSINGIALDKPRVEDMLGSYFAFVSRSNRYRDSARSSLSVASGGQVGRFWSIDHYGAVAELLGKNKTDAAFAYLFSFRPYINPERLDVLVFEIERRGEIYYVPVRAEKRNESTIIPN